MFSMDHCFTPRGSWAEYSEGLKDIWDEPGKEKRIRFNQLPKTPGDKKLQDKVAKRRWYGRMYIRHCRMKIGMFDTIRSLDRAQRIDSKGRGYYGCYEGLHRWQFYGEFKNTLDWIPEKKLNLYLSEQEEDE